MKNNSFRIQFNSSEQSFKPKFSQKSVELKPKVEFKVKPIDIYCNEIIK